MQHLTANDDIHRLAQGEGFENVLASEIDHFAHPGLQAHQIFAGIAAAQEIAPGQHGRDAADAGQGVHAAFGLVQVGGQEIRGSNSPFWPRGTSKAEMTRDDDDRPRFPPEIQTAGRRAESRGPCSMHRQDRAIPAAGLSEMCFLLMTSAWRKVTFT